MTELTESREHRELTVATEPRETADSPERTEAWDFPDRRVTLESPELEESPERPDSLELRAPQEETVLQADLAWLEPRESRDEVDSEVREKFLLS